MSFGQAASLRVENPETWRDAPLLKGRVSSWPREDVRNIMITGGAGFIASWVARHLTLTYPKTYNIVVFDNLTYASSSFNLRQLEDQPNFHFAHGNIENKENVMNCIAWFRIDTILHFAAYSHVDQSFTDSLRFTMSNVYGTHVLLECARITGISRLIHISTDEVYGQVVEGMTDRTEESNLQPRNPYAATKAAAEMLVEAYKTSYNMPIITVRSNNVYGPHQYPEKVIPKFTLSLLRGEQLPLQGSGEYLRSYLFAGDAADAIDIILHKGVVGEVYNVSSDDEISNLDLAHRILSLFGLHNSDKQANAWITHTADRPANDAAYKVRGDKLKELGWKQSTKFEEGLRITVDWYRRFGAQWWSKTDESSTNPEESAQKTLAASSLLDTRGEPLEILSQNKLFSPWQTGEDVLKPKDLVRGDDVGRMMSQTASEV